MRERGANLGWRRYRSLAPVLVLVLLCLVIASINGNFLSISNFIRLLSSAAIPLVLVMGATFVILMGSIDLSVEGVVALTAVVVSMLVANDFTGLDLGFLSLPVALFVGGLIGFTNGLVHVRLQIPSFMTTLGLGFACVGIATAVLGGYTVRISDRGFRNLTLGRILDVPVSVWVAALAVLVAWVIQERTRIGRWVYAIGTDEVTARQVGVPVESTRIRIFTIAGVFYGLGGAMSAAQLGQGHALISQGRLFTTITAVVVGGTALSGGVGSVLNSVIGVLIVVVLTNGMVLMGIPPFVQLGVQGVLIIIAVALALDRTRLAVVK
ncbi:MAG: ABC transporter permease [Geminicoccaceae bacterium]